MGPFHDPDTYRVVVAEERRGVPSWRRWATGFPSRRRWATGFPWAPGKRSPLIDGYGKW